MRRSSLDTTDISINRDIDSHYDNVKKVADDLPHIDTVANAIDGGTFDNVDVVITEPFNSEISTVANDKEAIESLYADKAKLDSLFADKDKLDSLFADKTTLDSLYADKVVLDSIFADKETLDSLYADKDTLDRIYTSIANIDRVFTSIGAIDSLYADIDVLDSLYADKSVLDRIHTSISNIDTVYNDLVNIDAVAGNKANIDTVADNKTSIDTVAGNNTNITTTAANISDVNIVADNIENVSIVAANDANITAVADNKSNIDAVVANEADIDSVASINVDVTTVAANIADIQNAEENANTATTKAAEASASADASANSAEASEVSRLASELALDEFTDTYLGAHNAEPSTDNDGDPLEAGALYLDISDSSNIVMKVYTGTEWVAAYVSLGDALLGGNNLSDVSDVTTARTNLDVYSKAESDELSPTATEVLDLIKTVDGAGSGLDADTLDGLDSSKFLSADGKAIDSDKLDGLDSTQFLRKDITDYMQGNLVMQDTDNAYSSELQFENDTNKLGIDYYNVGQLRFIDRDANAVRATIDNIDTATPTMYLGGQKVWNTGNDGAGSGLDADLLDGVDSSQFLRSDISDTFTGTYLNLKGAAMNNDGAKMHIPLVKGGQFYASGDNTGSIKIKFNDAQSADMMTMWVDVYDYTYNEAVSFFIGGYKYAADNAWVNEMAVQLGQRAAIPVRFGKDANDYACIWIGETTQNWDYVSVTVRDLQSNNSGYISEFDAGVTISLVTAFDTVEQTITDTRVRAGDSSKLNGYYSTYASTASTVVRRDGSGDINARLFRSEYDTTNSDIGFIMTQIDTASNNYIRPSTPAAVANVMKNEGLIKDDGHSFATNGYQKFSNGLILQWGTEAADSGARQTITMPISFPNAILNAQAIHSDAGDTWVYHMNWRKDISSTSTVVFGKHDNGYAVSWFAIGY